MELGVDVGVVDEGKALLTASVSIFTGVLFEKSNPLLIGAVVSVGWKMDLLFNKINFHLMFNV